MYKSRKQLRNSSTQSIPENYVTIQLRNNSIKKKYSHYRSSILHQIDATQSIVNNALDKTASNVKSAFTSSKYSACRLKKKAKIFDFSYFKEEKEKMIKQKRRKESQCEPKYRICQEIQNKLKQITNIGHHFDQACVLKPKKLKIQASELTLNLLLPNVDENNGRFDTKKNLHQKQIPQNWIRKLRNGKSLAEKMRKKLSLVKFQNQIPIKHPKINQQQNEKEGENQANKTNQISPRESYFRKQEVRKSAPLCNRNNTFYKLFCSVQGSKDQGFPQKMHIQSQYVRKLQQFARGIEISEYKKYDSSVHMGEFLRDTQNFKVLKNMYGHVKEKYAFQFKEMDLQEMEGSTLLSLVYYLENRHNMSELDKKNWKAKMNFIE